MTCSNFQFGMVDLAVINDNALSARDKVLYAILCVLSKKMGDSARPFCQVTVKYLSILLGRNERTVQIALNALIKRGIILRIPKFITKEDGQRWQTASLFIINGCHASVYPKKASEGFYFTKISKDVITNTALTMMEKMLFMVICSMADTQTVCANTYVRTLAKRMDTSMSVVYKGIKTLRENDILKVDPRYVGETYGRSACMYMLNANVGGEDFDRDVLAKNAGQINITYSTRQNTINTKADINARDGKKTVEYFDNSESDISALAHITSNTPYFKNTMQNHNQHTCDLVNDLSNVSNIEDIKKSYQATLAEVPPMMQPIVKYLFDVTGRTILYKKEIKALKALDAHDTPTRIREEINRAVDLFIAKGKPLTRLFFGYIWACLKKQKPTFNRKLSPTSIEHAKTITTQDRIDERQRRKELLNRRHQNLVDKKKTESKTIKLDWTNPATESRIAEPEAQSTVANLEKEPIFQESDKLLKALTAQVQQGTDVRITPNTSVPVTTHALTSTAQNNQEVSKAVSKEQVLDYLNENLTNINKDNNQTVEEILENTLKNLSQDEAQAKLERIWSTREQTKCCANCSGITNCPYHGFKQEIFPLKPFGSSQTVVFFSKEKCNELLEYEKQKQVFQAFERALKKSGLTTSQYSHTFASLNTGNVHFDVLNAKATAMKAVQDGNWLLLSGKSGTGKSHIATAMALAVMAKGKKAIFVTASELLSKLYAGFNDGSHDLLKKQYEETDCLIIDELDKERTSQGTTKYLSEIINYRYSHGLQTIFISNLSPEELILRNHALFEPLMSRLAEKGYWCSLFQASDYRASHSVSDSNQQTVENHDLVYCA